VAVLFRPVARLICAILLMQVVLAPAHCLAMAATPAGIEAVICSPDGSRTILVDPEGQEVPAHEATAGFCAACANLPQVALPEPPLPPRPAWVSTAALWQPADARTLPSPARAPPFAPRAPPAFA